MSFLTDSSPRPLRPFTIYKLVWDDGTGSDVSTKQTDGTVQGDIQPIGGSTRIVPDTVVATSTHYAYTEVEPKLKAGGELADSDGTHYQITWRGDWGDYYILALRQITGL